MTKEEIKLYYELGSKLSSEAKKFADEYARRIGLLFEYKEVGCYESGIYIKYLDVEGDFLEGLEINNENLADPVSIDYYVDQFKKEQEIENKKQIKDQIKDCKNIIDQYQQRLKELEEKSGTC